MICLFLCAGFDIRSRMKTTLSNKKWSWLGMAGAMALVGAFGVTAARAETWIPVDVLIQKEVGDTGEVEACLVTTHAILSEARDSKALLAAWEKQIQIAQPVSYYDDNGNLVQDLTVNRNLFASALPAVTYEISGDGNSVSVTLDFTKMKAAPKNLVAGYEDSVRRLFVSKLAIGPKSTLKITKKSPPLKGYGGNSPDVITEWSLAAAKKDLNKLQCK